MSEPLVIEHAPCPFCAAPAIGALRRDKKGRPYYTCGGCGTRAFIHDPRVYQLFKFMLQSGHSLYSESTRQGFALEVPNVMGA